MFNLNNSNSTQQSERALKAELLYLQNALAYKKQQVSAYQSLHFKSMKIQQRLKVLFGLAVLLNIGQLLYSVM